MYLNEARHSYGLSHFGNFKQKKNQFMESHMVSLWSSIKLSNRFTATAPIATAKNLKSPLNNFEVIPALRVLFLNSNKSAVE